jgi:hypothetical protein
VLLACCCLGILLWLSARLQLRVTLEGTLPLASGAQLWVDGAPTFLRENPAPSENTLALTLLGRGGEALKGAVVLTGVQTDRGGIIPLSHLQGTGDWAFSAQEPQWSARTPGSRLTWAGFTSGLQLLMHTGPETGEVEVEWNGVRQTVSLVQTEAGEHTIYLPARRAVLYAQLPVLAQQVRMRVPAAGRLQLVFGNETLLDRMLPAHETVDLSLGSAERARMLRQMAGHVTAFFARALCLLLLFLVVGLAVAGGVLEALSGAERLWVPIATGFSLLMVLTTSLSYALPVRLALPAALAAIAAVGLWLQAGRMRQLGRLLVTAWRDASTGAGGLAAIGGLSVLAFFFPVIFEGDWYLGQAYTDVTFYYVNLAQRFISERPLTVAPHEEMSRWSDIISLAAGAWVLGSDTRTVFAAFGGAFWLTVPFLADALLKRLGLAAAPARIGAVLLAFSANWFSLLSQGYLAQYLFVFALAWSAGMTLLCLQVSPRLDRAGQWALWTATAATYAFSISVYPFQFVLPVAWALTLLLCRRQEGARHTARELLTVGTLTLLLTNVSFSIILFFPKIKAFYGNFELLHALARNRLFPFYDSFSFATIALGLRDFVLNSAQLPMLIREALGLDDAQWGASLSWLQRRFRSLGRLWTWPAAALVLLGWAVCVLRRRREHVFLAVAMGTLVALMGFHAARGETYAFAKLVLTVGVFALLLMFLGLGRLWELSLGRGPRVLLGVFAAGFLVLNIVSGVLENGAYLLNRQSALLLNLRTHVSAIDTPIKDLAALVENEHAMTARPIRVEQVGMYLDRLLTDDDRVVSWRIEHLAQVYGGGSAPGPGPAFRVVFNSVGEQAPAGSRLVQSNDIFRVYQLSEPHGQRP